MLEPHLPGPPLGSYCEVSPKDPSGGWVTLACHQKRAEPWVTVLELSLRPWVAAENARTISFLSRWESQMFRPGGPSGHRFLRDIPAGPLANPVFRALPDASENPYNALNQPFWKPRDR